MQTLSTLHPALRRFLGASALCCLIDAGALEALLGFGMQQLQVARLLSLSLATAVLLAAGMRYVLEKDGEIKTAKGQPIPFSVLAVAGAVLNYTIFLRLLPLMPVPIDLSGRVFAIFIGAALSAGCNFALLHSLLPQKGKKGQRRESLLRPRTVIRVVIWVLFIMLAFASSSVVSQLHDINAFPNIKMPLDPAGPDAWLRLTQVRNWLSGESFFDHTVRQTNAPFGGISTHWTRPMDALVALYYSFTPSTLAINIRLMLAATWLPASLSLVTVALLGLGAGRHFRHVQALGCGAILLLVSVYKYTAPGDVDHHGLLTVLWCGVLALLLSPRLAAVGALGMGALLGIMVWVSPESLILAAAVYALLGIESLFKPEKATVLFLTACGAAVVATAGLLAEMPTNEFFTRQTYDSLSIVQGTLLWLTAAGAWVLALVLRFNIPFGARFFVATVTGGGVLLVQSLLYPKFFIGPLVDADPFIFTGFLPRILEARPLFQSEPALILRVLMMPATAAFLMGQCLSKRDIRPDKRRFLLLLSVLLAVTALLSTYQLRWGYYMQPVAIIAIAALLPGMATAARGDTGKWLKDVPRYMRTYLSLGCLLLAVSLLARASGQPIEKNFCSLQLRYAVQSQQLPSLLGDKSHVLYAPQDRGGEIQFFTPYRIIASNYHREGAGLRALDGIEKAKTQTEAKPLLAARKVDAMLFCPDAYPEDSWLYKLGDTPPPRWLAPVTGLRFLDMQGPKPLLLKVKQ